MDVPDNFAMALLPRLDAEIMSLPGAKMSTHEPKFEKLARISVIVDAPTVMADGSDAGDVEQASRLLFPAATVYTTPAATLVATAAFMEMEKGPPRLMLATDRPDPL
jgi:hypothetical protein